MKETLERETKAETAKLRSIVEETQAKNERDRIEVMEQLRREAAAEKAKLEKILADKEIEHARMLEATRDEADRKWSLAASELKDSSLMVEKRKAESLREREMREKLEADMVKLRKTAAKASTAAAHGMAISGSDWSARRSRLSQWQAKILKMSIPPVTFASRPVTRQS